MAGRVSRLVDTSVVIDVLRNVPAAIAYFRNLDEQPCLSVITVSEIRAGQRGERDRRAIDLIFEHSTVLSIDLAIAERAGAMMQRFGKSHSLDTADALIAATAEHHGLALDTLNLKHFPMFPALARPYP